MPFNFKATHSGRTSPNYLAPLLGLVGNLNFISRHLLDWFFREITKKYETINWELHIHLKNNKNFSLPTRYFTKSLHIFVFCAVLYVTTSVLFAVKSNSKVEANDIIVRRISSTGCPEKIKWNYIIVRRISSTGRPARRINFLFAADRKMMARKLGNIVEHWNYTPAFCLTLMRVVR